METPTSAFGACLPPKLPPPILLPPIARPPGLTIRWKHGKEETRRVTESFCVSWRTPRWWTCATKTVRSTGELVQEILITDVLPNESVRVWIYAIGRASNSDYSDGWEYVRPNDLFTAGYEGDLDACKAEYEKARASGEDMKSAVDVDGNLLAHWVAHRGHIHILRWMASLGFPLATTNTAGDLPLHWVCAQHRVNPTVHENIVLECVEFLLSQGSHINAVNKSGRTCLILSLQAHMLAVYAHLLSKGADVSIPDSMGDTVAHWAAYYGDIDLLAALVNTGTVSVCDKDSLGQTALHIAALQGQVLTVKYLIEHGPESLLWDTDSNDRTPRELAEQRSLDAITQLLRAAETNAKDRLKKERKAKKSSVAPSDATSSVDAISDTVTTPTTTTLTGDQTEATAPHSPAALTPQAHTTLPPADDTVPATTEAEATTATAASN